jgi:Fe-S-cluster-containing hydrogenase component 2
MRPILHVDTYACQTCASCQARLVCKTRAIVQYERGDLPAIDASRCRGCLICIPACPFGAVQKAGEPAAARGQSAAATL